MEKSIEKHLDDIMVTPGVTGVMCTDSQGLCVGVRGVAKRESAGQMFGMVQQAKALHADLKDDPVVCVESDTGSVLIKSHEGVTVAIHKSAT